MAREYLNPSDLAPPPQGLYNHVVKVGNQVFIAGQVSRGMDGKTIHVGDAKAQAQQVYANLEKAMASVGGSIRDIVKTTTYIVGAENLIPVREARLEALPEEGRSTSTTVLVAGLASPDLLVEVESMAIIGD
jgi:enamine deaminase RidA (YjgF/YER057c/UK114 family)